MDLTGMQKAVDKINTETIPKLTEAIGRVVDSADKHIDEDLVDIIGSLNGLALTIVDDLHGVLDRLNGTVLTVTVSVPERKLKTD